jgi:hypothetical protein
MLQAKQSHDECSSVIHISSNFRQLYHSLETSTRLQGSFMMLPERTRLEIQHDT